MGVKHPRKLTLKSDVLAVHPTFSEVPDHLSILLLSPWCTLELVACGWNSIRLNKEEINSSKDMRMLCPRKSGIDCKTSFLLSPTHKQYASNMKI
jgi:hypothetical protein